jgi:flagellin-specific chaperone FliS
MQKAIAVEEYNNGVESPVLPVVEERPDRCDRNRAQAAIKAYRNDELANLSPVQVIDKLYGVSILACKKGDLALANKAITELIVGLNFDYKDIAVPLYNLYQYSKDCIRKGNLSEAIRVLEELRSMWVQAFHL